MRRGNDLIFGAIHDEQWGMNEFYLLFIIKSIEGQITRREKGKIDLRYLRNGEVRRQQHQSPNVKLRSHLHSDSGSQGMTEQDEMLAIYAPGYQVL